ncbi:hypothetical protein Goklo_021371, partial [Gossypium klotzschianum]|nr:hypothetical protein [Gossypium klotzschianum]
PHFLFSVFPTTIYRCAQRYQIYSSLSLRFLLVHLVHLFAMLPLSTKELSTFWRLHWRGVAALELVNMTQASQERMQTLNENNKQMMKTISKLVSFST